MKIQHSQNKYAREVRSPCAWRGGALILELPKIKSLNVSIISSSICHEVMGPDARSKLIRLAGTIDPGSYSLITGYWSSVGDAESTLQEEGTEVQPLMLIGEGTKEKDF